MTIRAFLYDPGQKKIADMSIEEMNETHVTNGNHIVIHNGVYAEDILGDVRDLNNFRKFYREGD